MHKETTPLCVESLESPQTPLISVFLYFCSGFFPFLLSPAAPAIADCCKSTQCFCKVSESHQEIHAVARAQPAVFDDGRNEPRRSKFLSSPATDAREAKSYARPPDLRMTPDWGVAAGNLTRSSWIRAVQSSDTRATAKCWRLRSRNSAGNGALSKRSDLRSTRRAWRPSDFATTTKSVCENRDPEPPQA